MEKWTKIKSDHHWRRGNVVAKLPAWLWVRTLCCSKSSCTVYSTTLHRASNGKKEWWNRLDRMQHTIILFTFNCGKNFIRQFVFSSLLVCVCVCGSAIQWNSVERERFIFWYIQHSIYLAIETWWLRSWWKKLVSVHLGKRFVGMPLICWIELHFCGMI